MSHHFSTVIYSPHSSTLDRGAPSRDSQHCSQSISPSIHILDDDSLLNIFRLCRPVLPVGVAIHDTREGRIWARERWWYKLVHVCQRWRRLILTSASHLELCFVCTCGTPVADMLKHSPPFPLIVDYVNDGHGLSAEDGEGIRLALQHRNRVHRICLLGLRKLVVLMDKEFPVLEYLFLWHGLVDWDDWRRPIDSLPQTFKAPNLRHLVLSPTTFPKVSPLLSTTVFLATLSLGIDGYFHPNDLLERLAHLPQLETLRIAFLSPVPNHGAQERLLYTLSITEVNIPNLRWFWFKGTSAYLEALLPEMNTPLIDNLQITFFDQINHPVPNLLQYLRTAENLTFGSARFLFYDRAVSVTIYPRDGERTYTFHIEARGGRLDQQLFFVAQLFNALSPAFFSVEVLTLDYKKHTLSSEASRLQWRKLLMSFNNVKTLRVHSGLVGDISRSLQLEGEPPLELLPELKVLECPATSAAAAALNAFIDAREVTGRPVRLVQMAPPDRPSASTAMSPSHAP